MHVGVGDLPSVDEQGCGSVPGGKGGRDFGQPGRLVSPVVAGNENDVSVMGIDVGLAPISRRSHGAGRRHADEREVRVGV